MKLADIQIRDPFVVESEGTYYLFGSTDKDIWRSAGVGFDVWVGSAPGEFTDFEGPVPAFRPPADFWSRTNFWAPEVHRWRGQWYMFATFKPLEGCRGTAILSAEAVTGPYVPLSDTPVTPRDWECLDGTLYVDESQNPWMIFCHEWTQVGDGQVCAIRLAPDLSHSEGEPVLLFTASSAPWSAPLMGRAPGSYVTDGPYVVRTNGQFVILWSSFDATGAYCIGQATSQSSTLDGTWVQSDEPLFSGDGGHGMVFAAPDASLYLAIHTPNKTPDERAIFVPLTWSGDRLVAAGEIVR
ncbi:MAG: glycoside hydrolase family 43 protein [Propionibacteriaceae bacterium]|jgi:hypothetical protein|nr:glycoside hydrolase family 43 protein [Propionibacteriaceae bacterium]